MRGFSNYADYWDATLTHLPDSQHDMPLHRQTQGVRRAIHPVHCLATLSITAEPSDLEDGRDRECAQLAIKLKNCLIPRSLRTESLVMHDAHALSREAMFPSVN